MNAQALVGLLILLGSEAATVAAIPPFPTWNTPIGWTGFIVLADGIVYRARRRSWLRSAPREFAFLAFASIPLWLVFESFNVVLDNWYYVGLPENRTLRVFGYAWAFATIWPAIFEAADLVGVWRGTRPGIRLGTPVKYLATEPAALKWTGAIAVAFGGALLLWPIVQPSPYLAAPVFLGFIFLLDPINWRLNGDSLARDVHDPHVWTERATNLIGSGFLCGFLWEGLNYWSTAKWHYTVPILEDVKIFEMPVLGYFGFPAFALECFAMYEFIRIVMRRVPGFGRRFLTSRDEPSPRSERTGYPIGLDGRGNVRTGAQHRGRQSARLARREEREYAAAIHIGNVRDGF